MPNGESAASSQVRTVERAFALLFQLAAQERGVSLQQLARAQGCSRSTVHRLLATMEAIGVTEKEPASRHYRLGPRVRELCRAGWAPPDLRAIAGPVMRELAGRTRETVGLHLLDGLDHVVVEQCESPEEIRRSLRIGQRRSVLGGHVGAAMLAAMPPAQRDALLAEGASEGGPSASELGAIRAAGYQFGLVANGSGAGIVAPVLDHTGRVCAALSVSGPAARFTAARGAEVAPALVRASATISTALGHSASIRGGDDRDQH